MKHEEGTRLHFLIASAKTVTATILIMLTLTMSLYSLLPAVNAANPALTLGSPSGTVGQTININGTLQTAVGQYNIYFDSIKVKNGTSGTDAKFTTTFVVPQATFGQHTMELQDVIAALNATQTFIVQTSYTISPQSLPPAPRQLQEGAPVQLKAQVFGANATQSFNQTVGVTTPAASRYNATVQFSTNQTGTAESTLYYPVDFSTVGANTNYTGTYVVRLYKNASMVGAQNSFFIGLTNATSYHRHDWVNIRAMNYTKTNEYANITIALGTKQVNKVSLAIHNGEVIYDWQVPANASIGTYTVIVKSLNSTVTGTNKLAPDIQNFTVPGFTITFTTVNLNLEHVSAVNATIYQIDPFNSSRKTLAASGVTPSSGSIGYTLERGNYSVRAFYKGVLVNQTGLIQIYNTSSWTIVCQLTRIAITIYDGKTNVPLTFLGFVLNMTYRTTANVTKTETQIAITNVTATCLFQNQLIDANYTLTVYRAQRPFNTTRLGPIALNTKVYTFSLTFPVLSLTIHAEDAKHTALDGYPVKIFDVAGGIYDNATATTNSSGNVTFGAVFGQYRIRLYDKAEAVVLNETLFTLVNSTSLLIRSDIFNANLTVKIVGYFGQPIPNVKVRLEREGGSPLDVNTDGSGTAFFEGVVGGNSFVSVFVGGDMVTETTSVYVQGNAQITVSIGKYVNVLGFIMDTSQFTVMLTFIIFIVAFLLYLLFVRRNQKASATGTSEKKT